MTAPTVAVEWLLARAAVRATGRLHLVSRRDTDALNPICAANPIRSNTIETHTTVAAGMAICPDCTDLVARLHTSIAALLDPTAATIALQLLEVPLDSIVPTSGRTGPDGALADLAQSVALLGVLQPVLLRRTAGGFEIVSGRRRIAASVLAGRTTVPALVREISDTDAVLATLTENLHRADLNPMEQALAYATALEQLNCSQKDLATRLAVSPPVISNALRLLKLEPEAQAQIVAGALKAAHGLALLRYDHPAEQVAVAAAWAADGTSTGDAEQIAKASVGARRQPNSSFPDVAQLLTALLDARVRVTAKRITIDVADTADLRRLLEQLGAQPVSVSA